MPYIITVIAFVVIGVGFAMFKTSPTIEPGPTSLTSIVEEIKENTPGFESETEVGSSTDEVEPTNTPDTVVKEVPTTETSAPPSTPNPTKPATPTKPTPAPVDSNTYTNGTYRTQNSYRTPDGTYQMDVAITVSNDKVTSASLTYDSNGARDGYSKRFLSGYQSQVVGKSLEGLSVSRVGGASLTTRAFNSALASIRSQAS
jgi:hypothetical protein